jgi:hypothetical protein
MKEYKYKNKIKFSSKVPFDKQLLKVIEEKRIREHFSKLGKKSWETRRKKIMGGADYPPVDDSKVE